MLQDPIKALVDRDVLSIVQKINMGKTIENIIQEFEHGELPILDNMLQQMALLSLTEDLGGHIFIEEAYLSEALKTEKILRKYV
jgi:hypothetical protein